MPELGLFMILQGFVALAGYSNDTLQVMDPGAVAAPLIPAIIHQTWKDKIVPLKWRKAQQSCRDLHAGWRYMLWTDDSARQLVAEKYPGLLRTYEAYPYSIERADVLRWAAHWVRDSIAQWYAACACQA